ncbi:MAG: hypothetical protein NT121_04445 [Chloroflexi bacterium]|nr:hypothetical protein [Chloroflexota bacterium]
MNSNKTPWLKPGLTVTGLTIISLAGIAFLAILIIELIESGPAVPHFLQAVLTYREDWRNSTGNEFTGEATAWFFGISAAPVGLDLICRAVIRYTPVGERIKSSILRLNNLQRKYLMPLHNYLSIIAFSFGFLHLILSSCVSNPLPELGLILSGILVASGLLFKSKAVPTTLRKYLYQFHASLIISGVLLIILVSGHAVMSLD